MSGFDAIFFDLDGTLVESLPDIAHALGLAREHRGLPAVAQDDVRTWIGNGARILVARSLGTDDGEAPGVDELLATFREVYRGVSGDRAALYPGVDALLRDLRGRGLRVALTTNKPRDATDVLLRRLGATALFDSIQTPDDVSGRVKPDPAMLLAAARECDVDPGRCLLVGDGTADVLGARAAGMRVAAVLEGYGDPLRLRALRPDWCVNRAVDVRDAVIG